MPLGVEGRDVVLHDGPVASSALGGEHIEVVVAAVGFALAFMKAFFSKLLTALGAEEMVHVPGLLQSGHAFLWKKRE